MHMLKAKYISVQNKLKDIILEIKDKGFFHLLSSNFLVQLVTYGSQILLAGFLIPEDLSRVKTLQVVTNIAIIFAGAGIPITFLSNFSRSSNVDYRTSYFIDSCKIVFFTSLITFIVYQVLAFQNLLSEDLLTNEYLKAYLITIFLLSFNNLLTSYYQGQIEFKKLSSIQLISKTISLPIILYCTYLYQIEGYIYSLILSLLGSNLWLFFATKIKFYSLIIEPLNKINAKGLLRDSSYSFLSQLVGQGGIYMSFLILNYFSIDRFEFGLYAFALTLIQGMQIFVTSFQQFVIPTFSISSGTSLSKARSMLKRYEYIFFLTSACLIIIIYLFVPFAISFLFPEYEASILYLNLMLLAWGIRALGSLKGAALIGKGLFKTNFYTSTINLVISIPLSYFLINEYAVIGAVYAGIFQAIVSIISINFAYYLKIKKAASHA